MADESLRGPEDAFRVADAEGEGIGLCGGAMIKTGPSAAPAAQLRATLPSPAWRTKPFGPPPFTEAQLPEPLVHADFATVVSRSRRGALRLCRGARAHAGRAGMRA